MEFRGNVTNHIKNRDHQNYVNNALVLISHKANTLNIYSYNPPSIFPLPFPSLVYHYSLSHVSHHLCSSSNSNHIGRSRSRSRGSSSNAVAQSRRAAKHLESAANAAATVDDAVGGRSLDGRRARTAAAVVCAVSAADGSRGGQDAGDLSCMSGEMVGVEMREWKR